MSGPDRAEPSPLSAWLRAVPWRLWPVLPFILARALLDDRAARRALAGTELAEIEAWHEPPCEVCNDEPELGRCPYRARPEAPDA